MPTAVVRVRELPQILSFPNGFDTLMGIIQQAGLQPAFLDPLTLPMYNMIEADGIIRSLPHPDEQELPHIMLAHSVIAQVNSTLVAAQTAMELRTKDRFRLGKRLCFHEKVMLFEYLSDLWAIHYAKLSNGFLRHPETGVFGSYFVNREGDPITYGANSTFIEEIRGKHSGTMLPFSSSSINDKGRREIAAFLFPGERVCPHRVVLDLRHSMWAWKETPIGQDEKMFQSDNAIKLKQAEQRLVRYVTALAIEIFPDIAVESLRVDTTRSTKK